MLSVADLSEAVSAYRTGSVSLSKFEDWFRTASRSMFGESEDVKNACLAIEAAFSELRNGEMSESEFGRELANAICPFVQNTASAELNIRIVFGLPLKDPDASTTARPLWAIA